MASLSVAFLALESVCLLLNIPPLLVYIKKKDIPLITMLAAFEMMNLKGVVDVAVWGWDDYVTRWDGRGWCDFIIRVEIFANVACYTCIFAKQMTITLDCQYGKYKVWKNRHEKLWNIFQICICVVFPLVVMAATEVAFVRRYFLAHIAGCYASVSSERVVILVYYFWLFFWFTMDTVATALALYTAFHRSSKDLGNMLKVSSTDLTISQMRKMLTFCCCVLAVMVVTIIEVSISCRRLQPEFYDKANHPKMFWNIIIRVENNIHFDVEKWVYIACSFIAFGVFGLAKDARDLYLVVLRKCPWFVRQEQRWRRPEPMQEPSSAITDTTFMPDDTDHNKQEMYLEAYCPAASQSPITLDRQDVDDDELLRIMMGQVGEFNRSQGSKSSSTAGTDRTYYEK